MEIPVRQTPLCSSKNKGDGYDDRRNRYVKIT